MKQLRNFILVLLIFAAAGGYFGTMAWRSSYKAPREKIAAHKAKLQQDIDLGKQNLTIMQQTVQNHTTLFSRSFPLNRIAAQTQYQMWLIQLAEFCAMESTHVTIGEYKPGRGYATEQFQVKTSCTMPQLYRFLYEFYWSSYLHRINSLDIRSLERSDLLEVAIIVEGLTLAKTNPQAPYPLVDQFPISTPLRRMTSGPYKAYDEVAKMELFRYSAPGIDNANYLLLTGTPSVTDAVSDKKVAYSRWKLETEDRSFSLKKGERLAVGSFEGVIDEIDEDMVVLRQNNGYRWVINLGDKLSDAVAVPPDLF